MNAAFPWELGREFKHQKSRTSHCTMALPHGPPDQELMNQTLNRELLVSLLPWVVIFLYALDNSYLPANFVDQTLFSFSKSNPFCVGCIALLRKSVFVQRPLFFLLPSTSHLVWCVLEFQPNWKVRRGERKFGAWLIIHNKFPTLSQLKSLACKTNCFK